MFFSFDGPDGVGKTTQRVLFRQWLEARGLKVLECRDPGTTPLGERIRELLLGNLGLAIGRRSEMLLFMAARAQLVDEVIRPALGDGKAVVSDRFLLANIVYQGHAGGLDIDELWRIGRMATSGVAPDLTFVLDMAPEHAADRIQRGLDRMEQQGAEFQSRLRGGYLAEAARQPDRIVVIDAARPVDEVQSDIRRHAARLLDQARP